MNPYEVLGVEPDADADRVRRAYLDAVRRHPPDRDPETFRRVREAYAMLEDPEKRAALALFGTPGLETLGDLAASLEPGGRRVGPEAWLGALSR